MPTVGKKKFKYDEEGMAAAEAEAAESGQEMSMVDKVDDTLSGLDIAEEEPQQPEMMADNMQPSPVEEMAEEAEESGMPDQGMLMQLFRIVYREDFDPSNQVHQTQLSVIENTLEDNPEMAEKLKDGEMTMTDFALRVYKGMSPMGETPMTSPPVTPEAPEGTSYFA